jgi:uncharacterized protein (TIGR00299 family) protein
MRIAYLDCFAGISGDMFLGALIGAGVDPQVLNDATAALNLGASLRIETVDRSGISSTKVHVLEDVREGTRLAESPQLQHQQSPASLSRQPETQHQHKAGHRHTHGEDHAYEVAPNTHGHAHGRSLTVIRELIRASNLPAPVVRTAIRAFEFLGASEAKIHNVPVDQIHFHEVGAVDAIVDIVAASAGIQALAAGKPIKWVASPLNVGGGMVDCAHGRFPVPAPATADMLRGLPTYSASIQMELVTPTGAALIRTLVEDHGLTFGPQPAMSVDRIGYGAGTRNPKDFSNVLRISIGNEAGSLGNGAGAPRLDSETWDRNAASRNHDRHSETVTVLETALDDLSPQLLAHVADSALALGALDVMLTPVIMKKGRPGTLITVLCNPSESIGLQRLLLTETSTLGVRIREDRRSCLQRVFETVNTPYGPIRIKIGILNREVLNTQPEFEDCREAAAAHNVPVKQVQQAAIAAYLTQPSLSADKPTRALASSNA